MRLALSILALSLAACGGGGSGGGFAAAPASPVTATPEVQAEKPTNPGCATAAANHLSCEMVEGSIGVGVEPGVYVTFTNHTGSYLQVSEISAVTGERQHWSEVCAYLNDFMTGQNKPGSGEVGCTTKQVGEDYTPIRWGAGLSVAPGAVIYLASHTEPTGTNHTYTLKVKVASGLDSWRMPQHDAVIPCDGQTQSTAGDRWTNTSTKDRQIVGASIYAESSGSTVSGPACIYVFSADGSTKYQNCDNALRTRGVVSFPAVSIAPGESVAAQALNVCAAPAVWDWAAFLNITGE